MLRSVTYVRHYRDLHAGCSRVYTDAPTLTRAAATRRHSRSTVNPNRFRVRTNQRDGDIEVRSKNAESRLKSPARKLRAGQRVSDFPLPSHRSARPRRVQTDKRTRVFGTVNLHKSADKDNSHCLSRLIDCFAFPSNHLRSASNGSSISAFRNTRRGVRRSARDLRKGRG